MDNNSSKTNSTTTSNKQAQTTSKQHHSNPRLLLKFLTTTCNHPSINEESNECILPPHHHNPLTFLSTLSPYLPPQQFQLPNNFSCPIQLPGSYLTKRSDKRKNTQKRVVSRSLLELDRGLVPLPAKLCHICCRSCRVSPLLQCDYCPLMYHLDCLQPPLTSSPNTRWMCPNHIQHALDELLLDSKRLTQRSKLWLHHTSPPDLQNIKLNFLDTIHQSHPPFRNKVTRQNTAHSKIPSQIKEAYKVRLLNKITTTSFNTTRTSLNTTTTTTISTSCINKNFSATNNNTTSNDEMPHNNALPPHINNVDIKMEGEERNLWLRGILQLHSDLFSMMSHQNDVTNRKKISKPKIIKNPCRVMSAFKREPKEETNMTINAEYESSSSDGRKMEDYDEDDDDDGCGEDDDERGRCMNGGCENGSGVLRDSDDSGGVEAHTTLDGENSPGNEDQHIGHRNSGVVTNNKATSLCATNNNTPLSPNTTSPTTTIITINIRNSCKKYNDVTTEEPIKVEKKIDKQIVPKIKQPVIAMNETNSNVIGGKNAVLYKEGVDLCCNEILCDDDEEKGGGGDKEKVGGGDEERVGGGDEDVVMNGHSSPVLIGKSNTPPTSVSIISHPTISSCPIISHPVTSSPPFITSPTTISPSLTSSSNFTTTSSHLTTTLSPFITTHSTTATKTCMADVMKSKHLKGIFASIFSNNNKITKLNITQPVTTLSKSSSITPLSKSSSITTLSKSSSIVTPAFKSLRSIPFLRNNTDHDVKTPHSVLHRLTHSIANGTDKRKKRVVSDRKRKLDEEEKSDDSALKKTKTEEETCIQDGVRSLLKKVVLRSVYITTTNTTHTTSTHTFSAKNLSTPPPSIMPRLKFSTRLNNQHNNTPHHSAQHPSTADNKSTDDKNIDVIHSTVHQLC